MTALALALAFGFALAFAGWVLWLRERRGDLITDRVSVLEQDIDRIDELASGVPELRTTVEQLALKNGLRPK
jgi:hypothetical protein